MENLAELGPCEELKKECSRCGEPKIRKFFLFKIKNKEKERSYCSECRNKIRRRHYGTNRVDYVNRAKQGREFLKEKYFIWLSSRSCVDCGEKDIVLLEPEPDHVIGSKRRNISLMVNHGEPWCDILEELGKCVIRCSNCHKLKTAEEQGWYKFLRSRGRITADTGKG